MKLSLYAYLLFEEKSFFPDKMRAHIEFCSKGNKNLILGCDANAHHTAWGSNVYNKCGNELLEDILMYNVCLLNQGNEPTFMTRNRSEVIEITLCNIKCISCIKDWRVLNEITLSDHYVIKFSITGPANVKQYNRSHRKTD